VVLADDHALVRAGLRSILEAIEGVEVVGKAGDGHEALRLVEERQPHLAMLDVSMPGLSGIEAAARVTANHPRTRVLILSMHVDGEQVRRALRAGAAGYLVFHPPIGSGTLNTTLNVIPVQGCPRRLLAEPSETSALARGLSGGLTPVRTAYTSPAASPDA
jgi:YesN/AraC family two-component response regulator